MFKSIILLFFAFHSTKCDKTFTIVLDTTKSMMEELYIIKANIHQVLDTVNGNDFGNFVLVSFNDTGLPNIFITTTAFTSQSNKKLITHINQLTTSGPGNRCPENSLTGIEAALQASQGKQSMVFVFTDAYAYDHHRFESVEALCKRRHSQVIIFLSGYCVKDDGSQEGNVEVYHKLAKSCSGAVISFDFIYDLRQAFRFMKEIANVDWTDMTSYEFLDIKTFSFTVDSFTTDLLLVVTGKNPSLQITLNSGISGRNVKLDKVLQTKDALVVRFPNSIEIGEYTANVRGQGMMTVTKYERNFVPFEFGFSTLLPRSMEETSPRPIPEFTNYVLINVDKSIDLRSVEWLVDGESAKEVLFLRQVSAGSYVASVYIRPDRMFRFWIVGEDTETQQKLKSSSKFLSPQTPVKNIRKLAPETEMVDKDLGLIDYDTPLILACKVVAHPKPNIQWKDESGNYLTSEDALLEIPYLYISYVNIPKVSKNSTITCYAENSEGTNSKSIDIFVNRTYTFNVIQSPRDASVNYESSHYLYCEVDAYPEATLSWYLNNSLINSYTNTRVSIDNKALMIKNMGLEDVGIYECRATNGVEDRKFSADILISGLDVPELERSNTEISLKLGDSSDIECRVVKGRPAPEIVWKYKSINDYDYTVLPYGVSEYNGKLRINSVEKSHIGAYRCIATNLMGDDTLDINVSIKYPPIIKGKDQDNMKVKEHNSVHLSCDVDALPEATVKWELRQNGSLVPFDQGHRTDEKHNHFFTAKPGDSGGYYCIAENDVGRAEKIVTIQVQVPPYIMSPQNETIITRIGASVDLFCNVLAGSPTPTIKWDFQAEGSSAYNELNRGTSILQLKDLSQYDEGTYVCNAKNDIGFDNIRYHVIIQNRY